jgi:hypothetical protein
MWKRNRNFIEFVYYCMLHDDGRMIETCCGSNIRGREEELLCWQTINCLINIFSCCFNSGKIISVRTLYSKIHEVSVHSRKALQQKKRIHCCTNSWNEEQRHIVVTSGNRTFISHIQDFIYHSSYTVINLCRPGLGALNASIQIHEVF